LKGIREVEPTDLISRNELAKEKAEFKLNSKGEKSEHGWN
jgi:hypothetical protein